MIGWTDPEGARPWFGALLLAYYEPDGRLVYAVWVHTGNGIRSSAIRPMPTLSSTASSTMPIASISPATPDREQLQRIDHQHVKSQKTTASRTPLKRAISCRNSERT